MKYAVLLGWVIVVGNISAPPNRLQCREIKVVSGSPHSASHRHTSKEYCEQLARQKADFLKMLVKQLGETEVWCEEEQ